MRLTPRIKTSVPEVPKVPREHISLPMPTVPKVQPKASLLERMGNDTTDVIFGSTAGSAAILAPVIKMMFGAPNRPAPDYSYSPPTPVVIPDTSSSMKKTNAVSDRDRAAAFEFGFFKAAADQGMTKEAAYGLYKIALKKVAARYLPRPLPLEPTLPKTPAPPPISMSQTLAAAPKLAPKVRPVTVDAPVTTKAPVAESPVPPLRSTVADVPKNPDGIRNAEGFRDDLAQFETQMEVPTPHTRYAARAAYRQARKDVEAESNYHKLLPSIPMPSAGVAVPTALGVGAGYGAAQLNKSAPAPTSVATTPPVSPPVPQN